MTWCRKCWSGVTLGVAVDDLVSKVLVWCYTWELQLMTWCRKCWSGVTLGVAVDDLVSKVLVWCYTWSCS